MFGWLKRTSEHKPEKTIVYMRDLLGPARHWESPVDYDVWGNPFVYDYEFGKSAKEVKQNGTFGNYDWQHWKHKSGPQVDFNRKGDPSKSWFPPDPNDKIPL